MKELKRILQKYRFPKNKYPAKTKDELLRIERSIDWVLPEDYKYYAINYTDFEV